MEPNRPERDARALWRGTWGRLRHRREARLAVAVLVASLATALMIRAGAEAEQARDRWSPTTTAWTAAHDLDAGVTLTPADLVARPLPRAALPVDAVQAAPIGKELLDSLRTGEIVREGRLRGTDMRGGALRLTEPSPHLVVGDRVDLYRLLDGERVAHNSLVVAVDGDGIPIVRVDTSELPAVIGSLTTGSVVPVIIS